MKSLACVVVVRDHRASIKLSFVSPGRNAKNLKRRNSFQSETHMDAIASNQEPFIKSRFGGSLEN